MAVALQGTVATSNTRDVSSIDASLPGSIQSGELLILLLSCVNDRGVTTPTGWTSVASVADGFSGCRLICYRKAATGSEGASVTITLDGNAAIATTAFRLSGHDATTPVNASGTNSATSGADTAMTCPSVTTSVDGCLVLRAAADSGSSSHTDPASHTAIAEVKSGTSFDDVCCSSAYATQASAGGTGTAAFVASSGGLWTAMTVAIAPAAASGVIGPLLDGHLVQRGILQGRLVR